MNISIILLSILIQVFLFLVETVKDLIRYLRHDDENHEIRRFLGEAKVVVTDLLPIVKHYNEDEDLFDVTLRY